MRIENVIEILKLKTVRMDTKIKSNSASFYKRLMFF